MRLFCVEIAEFDSNSDLEELERSYHNMSLDVSRIFFVDFHDIYLVSVYGSAVLNQLLMNKILFSFWIRDTLFYRKPAPLDTV